MNWYATNRYWKKAPFRGGALNKMRKMSVSIPLRGIDEIAAKNDANNGFLELAA